MKIVTELNDRRFRYLLNRYFEVNKKDQGTEWL